MCASKVRSLLCVRPLPKNCSQSTDVAAQVAAKVATAVQEAAAVAMTVAAPTIAADAENDPHTLIEKIERQTGVCRFFIVRPMIIG